MDEKRRAKINRRLAQLDYADDPGMLAKLAAWPEVELIDRTRDLNALARLESRLSRHQWEIAIGWKGEISVKFIPNNSGEDFDAIDLTEAEARAEAIFRYLENLK